MWECLFGLVRMTGREAERLKKEEMEVLTTGRLGTHWLTLVWAYPAASGIMGVQLFPGVDKCLSGKLDMVMGVKKIYLLLRGWKGIKKYQN